MKRMTRTSTALLAAVLGSTLIPAAAQGSFDVVLEPVDDTYVVDQYPAASYGDDENLFVHSGSNTKRTWLKFDLGGIPPSAISAATLRLSYAQSSSSDTVIDLHHVADDTWTEATLTWASMPAYDAEALSTATTEFGHNDITWTVPVGVFFSDNDGRLSLALKIQEESHHSGTASFFSTEGTVPLAIAPQLFVTVPEPGIANLFIFAAGFLACAMFVLPGPSQARGITGREREPRRATGLAMLSRRGRGRG